MTKRLVDYIPDTLSASRAQVVVIDQAGRLWNILPAPKAQEKVA